VRQKFIETKDGMNVFEFECEGCGSSGVIEIPVEEHGTLACPEGCGAVYVPFKGLDGNPDLMCVVCPVYE
jgi:hypothetical protein